MTPGLLREEVSAQAKRKFQETKAKLVVGFRGMTQAQVDFCHQAIDQTLDRTPIESPPMDLSALTGGEVRSEAEPDVKEEEDDYLIGQDLVFAGNQAVVPHQRFWVGTVTAKIRAAQMPAQDHADAADEGTGATFLRIWWRTAEKEYGTYKRAYIPGTRGEHDEVWMAADDVICPVINNLTRKHRFIQTKKTQREQKYMIDDYFEDLLSDDDDMPQVWTRAVAQRLIGTEVQHNDRVGTITEILEQRGEEAEPVEQGGLEVRIRWEGDETEVVSLEDVLQWAE